MTQLASVPVAAVDVLKDRCKDERICSIGASSNSKIHHQVLVKNLARKGYGVVAVKPTGRTIAALQHYRSVRGLMAGETRRGRLYVR